MKNHGKYWNSKFCKESKGFGVVLSEPDRNQQNPIINGNIEK